MDLLNSDIILINILKYYNLKKIIINRDNVININILKKLVNLEELHIIYYDNNILNNIPENIKSLYISNLNIINLNFITKLKNITYLDISYNKNSNISNIILPHSIEFLNCESCNINDYNFINNLVNLKKLIISKNKFGNFNNVFPISIVELNMESIQIKDYKFIEKLINLKKLDISFNVKKNNIHLIKFPKSITHLCDYQSYKENYNYLKNLSNIIEYEFDDTIDVKLSDIDISKYYNLQYLDIQNCEINTDILLCHTKLKKIKINFNNSKKNIIIDLPISLECLKISNNFNINNYYFLTQLIRLKKIKIVNSYINILNACKSIEIIKFISCKSTYNFNFNCLEKYKKLDTLSLGFNNIYNLNECILPISIRQIIINNVEIIKKSNFLNNLYNLEYFEINSIICNDIITINLSKIKIKHFKIIYCNDTLFNIMLPDTIEIIEYIHDKNINLDWKKYKNLKKIKTLNNMKDILYKIYKNTNVEIEII
ncbi:leucine rich repeat gene family protein [Betaentomopoxvirus amoorei]|uniref:Uncharacterized leucine-rich repeat-containing protein AMV014/Q3 n=1 Tax=Amsacta moorei entomopoxvirus TaxID=28321 RepID=Y014_AMEPV|nr:leucine rich repeat gene family protein [Amsacta moorei entomopoxvirus]P28854.2 RecName: Full=Uncharacterized leucine-rich repeat-containing protein AMV014/Q3 [Amsacta moorei entomopoxvirus]AAG02720.1 AMV014 [Amsacta moorei entomopoxvirus]